MPTSTQSLDWRRAGAVFFLLFGLGATMLGLRVLIGVELDWWRWLVLWATAYVAAVLGRALFTAGFGQPASEASSTTRRAHAHRREVGSWVLFVGMAAVARTGALDELMLGLAWLAVGAAVMAVAFSLRL